MSVNQSNWSACHYGLSRDVTDVELQALFENFGKVESVTTFPSRNYAFIFFKDIESAKSARQNLQGHVLSGNHMKIEFAKLAKPCNSLWVDGINPSVPKEDFQNEFLKFGRIQDIRFFKDTNRAIVVYYKDDDATRALKNMNGKRVRGENISVDFLRPRPTPRQFSSQGTKENTQLSEVLRIRHPAAVAIEKNMIHNAMILFGEIESIKTFTEFALVRFRSVEEARRAKEGLQGNLFNDPRISIEFCTSEHDPENDYITHYAGVNEHLQEFPFRHVHWPVLPCNDPGHPPLLGNQGPDVYIRPPLGPQRTLEPTFAGPRFHDLAAVQKLQYPMPQTLVGPNWRKPFPTQSACNARFDAALPPEKRENKGGLDYQHEPHSQGIGEGSGSLPRITPGVLGDRSKDCMWRGIIAKGGTPICRAQCVPIGEGIGANIPDVVNCSARTGLDLLSKHYEDAIGFSVAFFLPDNEADFASYTEFLRYLGSKDRAGVAKCADDTLLFLVPPSDFLTKVLKVSGPERLYGVVLKFPRGVPCGTSMNPLTIQPQHAAYSLKTNSMEAGYEDVPPEEIGLAVHHSRVLPEDSKLPPNVPGHAIPSTVAASQASLFLTPELIATLKSLFPANNSSFGSQTVSLPQMPFVLGHPSNFAAGPDIGIAHCEHEYKALDHNNQPVQQRGNRMNSQFQCMPHAQASIVSTTTDHLYQTVPVVPSQSRPVTVAAPEINQLYQRRIPQAILQGQGIDNGQNAANFYSSTILANSVALSNPVRGSVIVQPLPHNQPASELELTDQCKQLQTGAVQESAEAEADKNNRYKTILLFAANLLSKLKQQPDNLPKRDAGSQ